MKFIKNTLFLVVVLCAFQAMSQERFIQLNEIVTNSAKIFTPNQLEGLKIKRINFENTTTNQLVILTIKELGYETKVDYGLEPYITDVIASKIIRNTMISQFIEELFKEINSEVDKLINYLNNPETSEGIKADEQKSKTIYEVIVIGLLSIFMVIGSFVFNRIYRDFIELFRGILTGKIGFFRGFLILIMAVVPIYFALLFYIIPFIFLFTFIQSNVEDYDSPFLWILVPFYGISILIAIFKILFKRKEDLKISLKSNKRYMRKNDWNIFFYFIFPK